MNVKLHKSVVASLKDNKEQQEFSAQSFLDYKDLVQNSKSITEEQFFEQFLRQKKILTQKHKQNFLQLKIPISPDEKALVVISYYQSFILFPDEEIKLRIQSFNFPSELKYFTPLDQLLTELGRLSSLGYRISYFQAIACTESILLTQGIHEAAKATKLLQDYRNAVLMQSRRKHAFSPNVLEKLYGNQLGKTVNDLFDLNIRTLEIEQKSIWNYEKKLSAGYTTKMQYKNLQNSITNPGLKQSEYFRGLVNLTRLLTKKEPHSYDSFLDNNLKKEHYNSYLSDFVKKIWLKK